MKNFQPSSKSSKDVACSAKRSKMKRMSSLSCESMSRCTMLVL